MLYNFDTDLVKSPCKAIVHGCNMQAKMNSGVAKVVREEFPAAYVAYMDQVYAKKLGDFIPVETGGKLIGNLLTQDKYGYDGAEYASLPAIVMSLDSFCYYYRNQDPLALFGYGPIAMPRIGCGRGGLKWDDVAPVVSLISDYHKIDFHVHTVEDEYK